MYVYVNKSYLHECPYLYMSVCVHMDDLYACIVYSMKGSVYIYVCMYICVCVCVCVCMCVCICVCVHGLFTVKISLVCIAYLRVYLRIYSLAQVFYICIL